MIKIKANTPFKYIPETDVELVLVDKNDVYIHYNNEEIKMHYRVSLFLPKNEEVTLSSDTESVIETFQKGENLLNLKGVTVIESVEEFSTVNTKKVYLVDSNIGGSFTLSKTPEADDNINWFNGYKRDTPFYITPDMVGANRVQNIVTISKQDYDNLSVKDPETVFMIVG